MNLERFNTEFSRLLDLLKKEGFPQKTVRKESYVYSRFVDFYSELHIIVERLEKEIYEYDSFIGYFKDYAMRKRALGEQLDDERIKDYMENMERLMLDLSDFYIYSRRFLDTLTMAIKYHLVNIGRKIEMTNSMSELLKKEKLKQYKKKIDYAFFDGLEKNISWVSNFKDYRDGLLHDCDHFVFTNTISGKLGYDIMNEAKTSWGTETVRDISGELQSTIDHLSDLLEYLSVNLPKSK